MKPFISILFLLVSLKVFAPATNLTPVIRPVPDNPYLPIFAASVEVESKGDRYAWNKAEDARGLVQCRQMKLDDYNLETGNNYTLQDCFDPEVSKKIWMHFAVKCEPWDIQGVCYGWNGYSKTNYYFKKVSELL